MAVHIAVLEHIAVLIRDIRMSQGHR